MHSSENGQVQGLIWKRMKKQQMSKKTNKPKNKALRSITQNCFKNCKRVWLLGRRHEGWLQTSALHCKSPKNRSSVQIRVRQAVGSTFHCISNKNKPKRICNILDNSAEWSAIGHISCEVSFLKSRAQLPPPVTMWTSVTHQLLNCGLHDTTEL